MTEIVPKDAEALLTWRGLLQALESGSATQADLARRFDVSQSTISRLAATRPTAAG